jgi:hypothetical protein
MAKGGGLDASYVSAFFGLAGMTMGGVMSFSTTWFTQRSQVREKRREGAGPDARLHVIFS